MEKTLKVINQMRKEGLFAEYAIGGGIGALFYAVANANVKRYEQTDSRVVKPEYLYAIMLKTNRPKDRERMLKMKQEAQMSDELLLKILKKYGLGTGNSESSGGLNGY